VSSAKRPIPGGRSIRSRSSEPHATSDRNFAQRGRPLWAPRQMKVSASGPRNGERLAVLDELGHGNQAYADPRPRPEAQHRRARSAGYEARPAAAPRWDR
jgi:hypothetical protein